MNLNDPRVVAARIESIVEQVPFQKSLSRYSLTLENAFEGNVSAYSSPEFLKFLCNGIERDGSNLYLVKKVMCFPNQYESVAKNISTDPIGEIDVLRFIGKDVSRIGYQNEYPGIQTHMIRADSATEAIRLSVDKKPEFKKFAPSFGPKLAGRFDSLITDAYKFYSLEKCKRVIDLGY